jgi:hypothetical protein
MRAGQRYFDLDTEAAAWPIRCPNVAAVQKNCAPGDGEPEAGSIRRLAAEKWHEYLPYVLIRNARAIVIDLNPNEPSH